MAGYRKNDPRWIEVPEDTTCGRCGAPVNAGASGYYYPDRGAVLCNTPPCGQAAHRLVQTQLDNDDIARGSGY